MSDVKKWDDVHGLPPEPEKDESSDPVKLKSHTRTMEDMLEQNDNQLDGVINNLPEDTIAEKEEKTSVVGKLKNVIPPDEEAHKPPLVVWPEREIC